MGKDTVKSPMEQIERLNLQVRVANEFAREVLEAICRRDGISLESSADPGKPARNYELCIRLGIPEVAGLPNVDKPRDPPSHSEDG